MMGSGMLLYSQNFSRIESKVGLGIMQGNTGVATSDFDNDGDLDLFVVAKLKDDNGNENSHSRLFRNENNGFFTDITESAGLKPVDSDNNTSGTKWGASWGDYNNDGNPDLFLTKKNGVQLYKNKGNGTFEDVTINAGLNELNDSGGTSALWFDYNNDGYLDLFLSDKK